MVISQGDVYWVDFGQPSGSEVGYRRPTLVVQGDSFNRSRIATVLCVPLTGNLSLAESPGNVVLATHESGLPRDSVANVSQVGALNRKRLFGPVGQVPKAKLELVLAGIDVVLGR